jgi:hypothetical protein
MMLFSTVRFWALGWIEDHFLNAKVNFKYYGFEWIEMLPPMGIYAIHVLMILASIGVILGFLYRISALILFLTFSYCQLLDLSYYLNHYYFVSIVCLFLIFVPANKSFSLDVHWGFTPETYKVPIWTINIFKLQLAIVYIYAGLAKLNYEWLINALPLKIWLPAGDSIPIIGSILKCTFTPYIFSWCGMLYDTFIVFFLLFKKTRFLAYLTVILFHTITGVLFQIGVFPLVMIGATLIFFSDGFHENLLNYLGWKKDSNLKAYTSYLPILKYTIYTFFIFQILFPWRFLCYPGSMYWTEQGYRFGWRVMLMEKAGTATFYIKDKHSGREGSVVNSEFLCGHQEKQMAMQPDMILQFAHFLKNHYQTQGIDNPSVRVEAYVTLNGKPSQLLIDPQLDLTQIKDGWSDKKWIINR